MLAIRAQYNAGRIEFIEPMPANILSSDAVDVSFKGAFVFKSNKR